MKLALGTVQFGMDYGVGKACRRVAQSEAGEIIRRAKMYGIDTLDTAIGYGESESVLGYLGLRGWKVVTKLPPVPDYCPNIYKWVSNQVQESMSRLKVRHLYGLLLHYPNQLLGAQGEELYKALQIIKLQEQLVDKIGFSIYAPKELDDIFNKYPIDIIQAPLNILDRRLVESGWASLLNQLGVEIHARSLFLQGLLLMSSSQRPIKFNVWHEVWTAWDTWLNEVGLTPLEACLGYMNELPQIDLAVIGVQSVDQLDEILAGVSFRLPSLPKFGVLSDQRLINPATWNKL
jgi:aryl-alcohol dehydrogenase-like predicted oxidoreductase